MINDLNKQIILQQKVIADLRYKLSLIRDILSDTKIVDKKGMKKEIDRMNKIEENDLTLSTKNKISTTTDSPKNSSKILLIYISIDYSNLFFFEFRFTMSIFIYLK